MFSGLRIYCGLLFILVCLSCGTSKITLLNTSINYPIHMNGKHIGDGSAIITRSGTPQRSVIEIHDFNGEVISRQEIRRRITTGTVIWAFLPYPTYLSLVFNWKYEREIEIFVNSPRKGKSSWDAVDTTSVWD